MTFTRHVLGGGKMAAILAVHVNEVALRVTNGERAEPLKGATPPKGGLATLPTTPPPLVGGSATEVSDLAVSLNVVGVGVGAQW